MVKTKAPEAPGSRCAIWIRGEGPASTMAQEIVELMGARPVDAPTRDAVLTITTEPSANTQPASASSALTLSASALPSVSVGPAGELTLPKDAALLAQIIAHACADGDKEARQLNVLVAGCHGGAGTSTVARGIGAVSGTAVLDASAHPHGLERVPLPWAQIDAADPPKIGLFGNRDGHPVIADAPGDSTRCTDLKVQRVLQCAGGPIVIDAGVWAAGLDQIDHARLILVCKASKMDALVEVVKSSALKPVAVVTNRPRCPEVLWIAKMTDAKITRPGRPKRLWRWVSE